jgi:hypothetical protein
MDITKSNRKDKRFLATFKDGTKIHFGLKNGSTYIDNKDKTKRENYIKRHQVRENFNNPKTAGSLSKNILWGDSTSINNNIKSFKEKFAL